MATYAQILALYQDNAELASLITGMMPDGVTPIATVQRYSAGFMSTGQSAKQYVGKQATSATLTTTVTLETVTTGKTFYISDIFVSTDGIKGATTAIDFRLQAAGTDIFRSNVHDLSAIEMAGIETQPFATSGQVVTISIPPTSGGVENVWYNVYGWEQ
jgi:hypothetical protein